MMKTKRYWSKFMGFLLLFTLSSLAAAAQHVVSGKVTDATGEPIIGATIKVVGTTDGTVTDLNGLFKVNASPQARLTVSYVGYQTQQLAVEGQDYLLVAMKDDNKN